MATHQSLPLYDLFLDLPHPAAASSCPPAFNSGCPSNNPEIEKEISSSMSRISRFAFPEFDDSLSQSIPRDAAVNRFSLYAMQTKSFQNYTFSMQLQSGVRVHGFVRRYLPIHQVVNHRYDVGRRGERALVILTRFSGGDLLYASILKTIDAISFQKQALNFKNDHPAPQKWFLDRIFEEHRKLCNDFMSTPDQEQNTMMLTVELIEVGNKSLPFLIEVDKANFIVPTCLLAQKSMVEASASSPILPLLRVLGVASTLRLLSALLSENRVLIISGNPTRLAQCARSALSVLAQGLLNWQHLYIPVLPPHLFQYLGAPVPYLIGMLSSFVPKLKAASDGLGEMVIINLDTNELEVRGMNPMDTAQRVPDLFQKAISEQGMPAATSSEILAQDLVDLLKMDKRFIYGESTLTNVSETAAKATKAVKSGITSLARKGKNFFNNRKVGVQSVDNASNGTSEEEAIDSSTADDAQNAIQNTMSPDVIYIQGSQNEIAEEEARIAFSSFFLSLFGNMRWYLSASPGQLPHLDRKRFLQQKRAMGEGENTAIWPLLQNFCKTQMLEEFAIARVEEVRLRSPVTSDSPLFTQCVNYHHLNNIEFDALNVRRVARQVAQNNPSRLIIQTSTRRTTMLLTSNKTYEGDYNKAVVQLVEQCRECTSVLSDVMSVIWVRMRDSKGVHWKHGLQALQVLRNLLYHGPLAAIAEATDGLDKIRAMKFYNDNMRSQICTQIRQAAHQVYNLLVDRAKLFNIRRICVNKRRLLKQPEQPKYKRETRFTLVHPFSKIHQLLNPLSSVRVAPAPPMQQPPPTVESDIFGLTTTSSTGAKEIGPANGADATQDMIGLFRNVDMCDKSSAVAFPAIAPSACDPFSPAPMPNAHSLTSPQHLTPPRQAILSTSCAIKRQQQAHTPLPQLQQNAPQTYHGKTQPQNTHVSVPPHQHRTVPLSQQPTAYGSAQPMNTHVHVSPQKHQHMPPPKQQEPTLLSLDRQHAPVTYGNIQPQNIQVSIPPPQHRPMPSQQNFQQQQQQQQQYYQHHPGHYPQHQGITGYPPSTQLSSSSGQHPGYRMSQQQHYQTGGQQQTQVQQYTTHQPLPAQPSKPNLSQFDPFQ
mmetsp:Transcript_56280/g.63837  ORF Transcript_56280/g.63837 Transcript_56280/m.63837 type:complete len:1100 (+) Transcript_56280:83-3382(+)